MATGFLSQYISRDETAPAADQNIVSEEYMKLLGTAQGVNLPTARRVSSYRIAFRVYLM